MSPSPAAPARWELLPFSLWQLSSPTVQFCQNCRRKHFFVDWEANSSRVKFGKRELLVNGNFTSLVNGNPILLQIYALDFIQTHVNLEFDTCIFTGVEKYISFDRDYERYNAKLKY